MASISGKRVENIYVMTIVGKGEKINRVGKRTIEDIGVHLQGLQSDNRVQAAVLTSDKKCFFAGISNDLLCENAERSSRRLQALCDSLENSSKPIVAAIGGLCSGIGLEIALACHYRIALDDKRTTFSLPEVTLGLLPCAGGTQRLPRLVGVPTALDMVLSGKTVNVEYAVSIELLDQAIAPETVEYTRVVEGSRLYLEAAAVAFAKKVVSGEIAAERTSPELLKEMYGDNSVFTATKTLVNRMSRGLYPAPLKILDVIRIGINEGQSEGFLAEAKAFQELSQTPQSRELRNLNEARGKCRVNRLGKPERPVNRVGIVGIGLMGTGIAQVSLQKGIGVMFKARNKGRLEKSAGYVRTYFDKLEKKKSITRAEKNELLESFQPTLDYSNFKKADMVIEVIAEDLDIKLKVFRELEAATSPDCILASGTSALSISKLASYSSRPEKVIGMHYFSPVDKMQLLEIVTLPQTSPETVRAAVDLGLRQGKTVITVKDGPGFYTTRVLAALMEEAVTLMQEGFNPKDLNSLCRKWGFPVGCVTLLDEIGTDVNLHIVKILASNLGARHQGPFISVFQELCNAGFLGRKSGKGIFLYEKGSSKNRPLNPGALEIFRQLAEKSKGPATDADLQFRLVACFVNEAVLCLEEGIIENPADGDVGAVFGLGFPPFTGGPFRWVDAYGAGRFVAEMKVFEEAYGWERYRAAETLQQMARNGMKKFYDETGAKPKL